MSKVAHYLQEHLNGEVMTSTDARRYFAADGSILQLAPALIAYPRNENDVRKTARFSWQLAERGRIIPVTSRGSGTNQTGAALGSGIMVVFPAHMNRVLELDSKSNTVTVEPGINFGKLQQTLHTHGRFVPPYPASVEYSTIGGAIANNSSGEKSVKYGDMKSYVAGLRVVLANGEVIETSRLSKRELSKKLGLATFEGEIYRSVDTLLEEKHDQVTQLARVGVKNNAGYNLLDIKRNDGSFDLTPLFVGSQGTLGLITEAVLDTEPFNPPNSLIVAQFDSLEQLQSALVEIQAMDNSPSALELVSQGVLQEVHDLNPNQLQEVAQPPFADITILAEFDDSDRNAKKLVRQTEKIFEKYAKSHIVVTEPEEQQKFWKLRQATSSLISHNEGLSKAVPLVDASVAPDRMREYLEGVYSLLEANGVKPAVWGHAGQGNLYFQPKLNLAQVGDRQKAFRLLEDHNNLVIKLGGSISSSAGDGRLRTPYLEKMYGAELYGLLQKVKNIFDPYGMLNPGVKFGTSIDDLKAMIRSDYGLDHIYDHLPRS
ncbi:MAG TPA: FAD-binding oxidoreductase [Methylomirabilota bacterium]|nr:FAD-binding oxidoreductase [Methylomirabilota bacterium]